MKKYEKYKDSGNEYFKEVPSHWKILNFRHVIDVLTDFTANGSFADLAKNVTYLDIGFSRLIRLTDLRENLNNNGVYVSEDSHNYLAKSSLCGDEILLANVGAYAGLAWKVPILNTPGTLGPNMFLLKFNSLLRNNFAYYTLVSEYLFSQLKNKAVSSAQPKLNKEDVRSCTFVLPPVEDQFQIVQYLDYQTGIIDSLIAKKEKLVGLLKEKRQAIINEAVTKGLNPDAKMKDSGIEWLGEVPEDWDVNKLKFIAKLNPSKSEIDINLDENSEVSFLPMEKVSENWDFDKSSNAKYSDVSSGLTYFRNGDLIIAKITPCFENGKAAILEDLCNGIGFGSTEFHTIRPINIEKNYLFYVTRSDYFMSNGESFMTGSAGQKRVPTSFVNEFFVPIPSTEEQMKISRFIGKYILNNNNVSNQLTTQIERLKEYRQSIISEAITGKVDVRDWQPGKKQLA